jgi:hypothetical protein
MTEQTITDYLRARPAKAKSSPSKVGWAEIFLALGLCVWCGWSMLGFLILSSAPGPVERLMAILIIVPLNLIGLIGMLFVYKTSRD